MSRFGTEDDGYRNRTLYARVGWAPSATAAVDASLRYRDSRSMFDPQDFSFVGFNPSPTFGLVVDGDRRSEGDQFDALSSWTADQPARSITSSPSRRRKTEEDTFADGIFTDGLKANAIALIIRARGDSVKPACRRH